MHYTINLVKVSRISKTKRTIRNIMKKLIAVTILILSLNFNSYSQATTRVFTQEFAGQATRNGVFDTKKYNDTEGTPYIFKEFMLTEIVGFDQKLMMRYNAEADEIEFKKNETETIILSKEELFNTVIMNFGKYKLRLLNYKTTKGEGIYGYLAEVTIAKDISLLRRDKIILEEARQPKTTFESYIPAKLVKAKSDYYLELKDKSIIAMPSSKKELIAIYPNKKEAITTYLKENNFSCKDENDLIKITEYISTL